MVSARRRFLIGSVTLAVCGVAGASRALADIKRLERIRRRVQPDLETLFADHGMTYPPQRVLLRAFKHEATLELWAAETAGQALTLVNSYAICKSSGVLGPKRRYGDLQVPEGVYEIHRYNAWSGFHMSLRVDYPNASDRIRGVRGQLGGAIMVHGDCVTIGCIPIEDKPIEQVFLTVLDASRAGKKRVPIHIFPAKMSEAGMKFLEKHAAGDRDLLTLWRELQPIYQAFEDTQVIPDVEIDPKTGAYRLVTTTPVAS
jgi:murein L,D-transpeptidase YafK